MEPRQDRHYEDDVESQGHVSDDPGDAVVDNHEQGHQHHADEGGGLALHDGIAAQGGADRAVFDDLHRGRQAAGAQHDGQVLGLFLGSAAGDDAVAAGDPALDDRRGVDRFIQHDGQALADVFAGHVREELYPFVRGGEIDDGFSHVADILTEGDLGVLEHAAGHLRLLAHQIEEVVLAFRRAFGFAGEEEFHLVGNQLPGARIFQHGLYPGAVFGRDGEIFPDLAQQGSERCLGGLLLFFFKEALFLFFLGFFEEALFLLWFGLFFNVFSEALFSFLFSFSRGLFPLGGGRFFFGALAQDRVEADEEAVALLIGLQELEFEEGGAADQVFGALHILHPGQLHDDAVVPLLLDGGFGHAELVDAVADDFPGAVHRVLGLVGGQGGQIDLQHQVNAALKIQTQVERALLQVCQGEGRILFHGGPISAGETVELETRIQVVRGDGDDRQDQRKFPVSRHVRLSSATVQCKENATLSVR